MLLEAYVKSMSHFHKKINCHSEIRKLQSLTHQTKNIQKVDLGLLTERLQMCSLVFMCGPNDCSWGYLKGCCLCVGYILLRRLPCLASWAEDVPSFKKTWYTRFGGQPRPPSHSKEKRKETGEKSGDQEVHSAQDIKWICKMMMMMMMKMILIGKK